jgi:hypothetical protein
MGKGPLPPEHVLAFTAENVEKVHAEEGAFRLMDQEKVVILIKGADNMQELLMEYLETYRKTCEYFYLAAKKFSMRMLEMEDIGLFDLTNMKVIKSSGYLFPDIEFRSNLMKRIKNNFRVLTNAVEDPFQRTILEF